MRAWCSFLAFNGYYKLFGWLYVGELGAHDADWCVGADASCRKLALPVKNQSLTPKRLHLCYKTLM